MNDPLDVEEYFFGNWQEAIWYPTCHEELTTLQWRWEFLRRTKMYQRMWEEAEIIDATVTEEIEDPDEYHYACLFEDDQIVSRWRMSLMINPTTGAKHIDFLDLEKANIFKHPYGGAIFTQDDCKRVWKHIEKFNVRQEMRNAFFFSAIVGRLGLRQREHFSGNSDAVIAGFDLTRPLPPQLKLVEKRLESQLRKRGKKPTSPKLTGKSRKLWPLYLRLIDADDAGAKAMEIFRALEREGIEEIQGASNEASKIVGMISAARQVQEKIIYYL